MAADVPGRRIHARHLEAVEVGLLHPAVLEGDLAQRREADAHRSEEHTSELQSLMRISYAVFCLKKKNHTHNTTTKYNQHTKPITITKDNNDTQHTNSTN